MIPAPAHGAGPLTQPGPTLSISDFALPRLTELWSLRDDTHVDFDSGPRGSVLLDTRWGELRIPEPGEELREALRRMLIGPVSLRNVLPDFPDIGVPADDTPLSAGTAALLHALSRLQHVVVRMLAVGPAPLLSVVPLSEHARFAPRPLPEGRPCRLSRFAVLRHAEDGLRMESPLSHHRVELLRPEATLLLSRLGSTRGTPWQADAVPALSAAVTDAALSYLAATGMVLLAEPPEAPRSPDLPPLFSEDHDPALLPWSADDLLVHSRSRLGRHDGDFGAAFSHADRVPPEPVVKPPVNEVNIPLFRPDLDELQNTDPPFTAALESDRPLPRCGSGELTARQIGSLLYRAARVRSLHSPDRHVPQGYLHSDRPYPSIGDTYALELYLLAGEHTWPAPGAYHYNPLTHCLEKVDAAREALAELSANARTAANLPGPPPLLLTITARFSRSSYKFSGVAYTSILKDVGALQQTLSLVATTLGLGSCALAVGDADAAVRAFGLDWRTESSVGDFLIGPPATAETGPARDVMVIGPLPRVGGVAKAATGVDRHSAPGGRNR